MKRTLAILFLILFLFNVGGYYLAFLGLKSHVKNNLLDRLDADSYSSNDEVILTLPVTLPYPLHEASYERTDGEIEYQGEFYHLVKQKVQNDTLFMVCVKDRQQKKLQHAMNEFTKLSNNLPTNTKHTMDLFGKLFKDFTNTAFAFHATEGGWNIDILFAENSFPLIYQVYSIDSPPPEVS